MPVKTHRWHCPDRTAQPVLRPRLRRTLRKDSPVNGTSAPVFRLMSDS